MIFYITSFTYREIIHRTITELDLVCAGNECSNEIYLMKYIRENISRMGNLDEFVVDITALQDTDAEIIQAFEMLRIMNYKTRLIILAPNRQPGDELLKQCFEMGLYDLILSNVFADVYEELKYCLTVGKQYKDAMRYRTSGDKDAVPVKKELKRTVNKILIGIAGAQHRIGCTHLSIVIANYLRKKGYMVALMEYERNGEGIYESIQEAYEEPYIEERYFALRGVDYFAHTQNQDMQQLLASKFYNFIIVDFGLYSECDQMMFSKCDIRMIVSGAKPWETSYIGNVFQTTKQDALKQMTFIFNFTAEADRDDIRKEMTGLDNIYFMPLADNPFSSEDIGDMEKLFAFYDQEQKVEEKKKRSFLGKLGRK